MAKLENFIGVKLRDDQIENIHNSGLTVSEYVRRAIDYYNDPNKYTVNVLQNCLTMLNDSIQMLNGNVKPNLTNVEEIKSDLTNMKNIKHNLTSENQQEVKPIDEKLNQEVGMLKRILQNPENNHTVPDVTIKLLSKKYDLNKARIQTWITDNKDWILGE